MKKGVWNFHTLKEVWPVAWADLRRNRLGQLLPLKPEVLNLLVNDVCNSRCQTCMIWRRRRDTEISPEELANILADPLFSRLRHIGVSGGEPSLRPDLPELFAVIADRAPVCRNAGIITNALQPDLVVPRITASYRVCAERGVGFRAMVSLDGIGPMHDRLRGKPGNFEAAVRVIDLLREKGVRVVAGCTVSRNNIWEVDEVREFCATEEIPVRFRVAEFINRLDNREQTEIIRNFTPRESLHLGMFFFKLEQESPQQSSRRRIYRSIRRMLLAGAERERRCNWQTTAVTLDCRGNLLYCSPRSSVLGNCGKQSAERIYHKHIGERRRILRRYCRDCIHDNGDTRTLGDWLQEKRRDQRRRDLFDAEPAAVPPTLSPHGNLPKTKRILIIGWYGTETAGDKAILAALVRRLRRESPEARVQLASMNPDYSRWTLEELSLQSLDIMDTFSRSFPPKLRRGDEVVMGGGPLMHIPALGMVLNLFRKAAAAGAATRILGCGIGPLDKGKRFKEMVEEILLLARDVELRDSDSLDWARKQTGREDIILSGDPARETVENWRTSHPPGSPVPELCLFLRRLPLGYARHLHKTEFSRFLERVNEQLVLWTSHLATTLKLTPRFLPMHCFSAGGDDREYARALARRFPTDKEPLVENRPLNLDELLTSMQAAQLCVCMRFHSVLFAHTLGVPFIAIDYTRGGKITAYLKDHRIPERKLSLEDLAAGAWSSFSIPDMNRPAVLSH